MSFLSKLSNVPAWAKGVAGGIAAVVVAIGGYFGYEALFGGDTNCYAIPQNAAFVLKVDAKELLSQGDIDLKELVKDWDFDEKDIEKSGINPKKPAYVFAYNAGKKDATPLFGAIAAVADEEKFEKFFEDESDENLKDKGDYKMFCDNGAAIAVDGDKILILGGGDEDLLKKQIKILMDQGKSESIVETKLYEEMNETENAISCALDFNQLLKMIPKDEMPEEGKQVVDGLRQYKDFHMRAGLRIENNKFVFDGEMLPQTDKAKQEYEKSLALMPKLKGDFLACDDDAWMFGACGFDGDKFMKELSKNTQIDNLFREAERESGISLSDVIKSFNGDAAFSLGGDPDSNDMHFGVYAQASEKNDVLRNIIDKLNNEYFTTLDYQWNDYTYEFEEVEVPDPNKSITETGNNQYEYSERNDFSDNDVTVYFGIKDGVFYLSNVNDEIPSNSPKGMLKNLKDELKSSRAYFAMDIAKIIKMIKEASERDYKEFKKVIKDPSILDKFVVRATEDGKFEAYLSVEEGKKIRDLFFD